jgi:microcystin-dependent protein
MLWLRLRNACLVPVPGTGSHLKMLTVLSDSSPQQTYIPQTLQEHGGILPYSNSVPKVSVNPIATVYPRLVLTLQTLKEHGGILPYSNSVPKVSVNPTGPAGAWWYPAL